MRAQGFHGRRLVSWVRAEIRAETNRIRHERPSRANPAVIVPRGATPAKALHVHDGAFVASSARFSGRSSSTSLTGIGRGRPEGDEERSLAAFADDAFEALIEDAAIQVLLDGAASRAAQASV